MTHGCFIEEANRSKELANTRRPFQTKFSGPASGDAPRVRRAPRQHGASFCQGKRATSATRPYPKAGCATQIVFERHCVCALVRTYKHALTSMRTTLSGPVSRKSPGKSPGVFTVPQGDLQDAPPMRPNRFDHPASESCTVRDLQDSRPRRFDRSGAEPFESVRLHRWSR